MRLVSIDDAAVEVKRTRGIIFRHIAAGRLKRYRKPGVDRRTFVDLDALTELMGAQPVDTAQETT